MKTFLDFGIEIQGRTGEVRVTCPQCSEQRKKKTERCLAVNTDEGVWNCHHCGWTGTLKESRGENVVSLKTAYRKPEYQAPSNLPEEVLAWFSSRGISEQTLAKARIGYGSIYMPQLGGEANAVQFPYYRGDEVVNIKYRDGRKNFRMVSGAERVLYGLNDILAGSLIVVEGEMDKLAMAEAGFWSCVSVPDGAPSPGAKEYSGKFEFLSTAEEVLEGVKKVILAVDSDAPGKVLEDELARRFGWERCYRVEWPEDCKDANDVLMKHKAHVLADLVKAAKPYPIAGVFEADDIASRIRHIHEHGMPKTEKTGWRSLDNFYSVRAGELTVVTGIPGHGKSEWLDALVVNIANSAGWRFGIFSPENQPLEFHVSKLAEKVIGKPFAKGSPHRISESELDDCIGWVRRHISFILPDDPTLNAILSAAKAIVYRHGIRGMVVDPWNEIEHSRPNGMTETEYISQALSQIRNFARRNGVHVWVVAHPAKMQKEKEGGYPVPTPYDISGSAHWRNKADNCLTVYRKVSDESRTVEIHVQKIRFKDVGRAGHMAELLYNTRTGQYEDWKGVR